LAGKTSATQNLQLFILQKKHSPICNVWKLAAVRLNTWNYFIFLQAKLNLPQKGNKKALRMQKGKMH
jgi:hypothetical protein